MIRSVLAEARRYPTWTAMPLRQALALLALLAMGLAITPAHAVPSFAQQTGMPCQQCHTTAYGPALTDYGRQFKLNGYVFGSNKPVVPVALMIQGGYTQTSADQPTPPAPQFGVNGQTSVDQISLFIATRLTDHLGLFSQITYDGIGHVTAWDNTDLRYARSFNVGNTALVTGVSVNNNPTVQDLWNSTPAWGFPYISSALAPAPTASPYIGGLGATVLGATAYVMVNGRYYFEAGGYRGLSNSWLDHLGVGAEANPNLSGLSPYWRAAVNLSTGPHFYSFGTFGLDARVQPDPTQSAKDHYTDYGFDATYQYAGLGKHVFAANASLIDEQQNLAATLAGSPDPVNNNLQFVSVDLSYAYDHTWVATISDFSTTGSTNATLYQPGSLTGFANGSPDSDGYRLQLEFVPFGKLDSPHRPWMNLRLGLQYTGYTEFNGASTNYDGAGRNASDNNTLFGFFWVII
jgi:hypothetical protein